MSLKKKDYMAMAIGLGILLVSGFVIASMEGIDINPFTPKAYVKLTGGVDCSLDFCWFNKDVTLDVSTENRMSSIPQMAWWCGPLGGAKDLEATLTVQAPDLSTQTYNKKEGTCEDRDIDFFFTVPLDKGIGNYKLTGTICGDTLVSGKQCTTVTKTLYYGGN